ncbi:MAG: Blue-light-activated protein [Planctomycetes bacterium ADurb.Bin069]|nr:MAG: Blue-light-activated protein [Planctomycetes bacterium ADurb.Bin069]
MLLPARRSMYTAWEVAKRGFFHSNDGWHPTMNSPDERGEGLGRSSAPKKPLPGFEHFFQSYPDSVFLFDPEGCFVAVNPAAAAFFATTPEAFAGRHMHDLFPPEIAARQLAAVVRVFETGEALAADEALTRIGQDVRWFNTTLTPIKDARGRVTHVMGVARDISAWIALREEQARRMEHAAEACNAATSGRLTHDFKNLLTVVLGYARLLLKQAPEHLRAQVARIQRAAETMASLLASSCRREPDRKVVDLNALLGGMTDALAALLGAKINIEFRPCTAPAPILADTDQIEQIVLNLAFNARDAMPEGGTIAIRTEHAALDRKSARRFADLAPGPHAVLTFADTGRGMDAATRRRLFEPFFTTKPEGCGTGLGLPTVYAAVRQHQGHIEAASTLGKGTTFTIYLPLATAPPVPQAGLAAPSARGRETVLVIDDDGAVRELIAAALREHGYRPLTAATPEEALALWNRHEDAIDLCIADVLLRGMNGKKLTERFQGDRPGFKVLFMSACGEDEVFHKGLKPAGTRFLPKPFTVDALLKELRATLAG